MSAAARAVHFHPLREPAPIDAGADGALERLVETRPSGAALVLGIRAEEPLAAGRADERAVTLLVVQSAGKCPLRALLAQHVELLGRQRVAPLVIGLVDGELCGSCHLILSGAGGEAAERETPPERGRGHEQELYAAGHVDFRCLSYC